MNKAIFMSLAIGFSLPTATYAGPVSGREWLALLDGAEAGGVINLETRAVEFVRHQFRPAQPVKIVGGRFPAVTLDGWQNVTFENSIFEPRADDVPTGPLLLAYEPANLTLRNVTFVGRVSADGELAFGGINIRGGRNVTVTGSSFSNMIGSNAFLRTDGVIFSNNDMQQVREGIQIVGAKNVEVLRNRFGPFRPAAGDHSDGIQLYTAGLSQPSDHAAQFVRIADNLIVSDPEGRAQGIFLRDEAKLGDVGRGYSKITIEGNLLIGTGWHGIGIADKVADLLIANNILLTVRGRDGVEANWILVKSAPAVVHGNRTSALTLASGVTNERNQHIPIAKPSEVQSAIAEWMLRFRLGECVSRNDELANRC